MNLATLERLAKIASWIAVPIVVATIGWYIRDVIADRNLGQQYVELAVSILETEPEGEDQHLRQWAVDLLDEKSPTPLREDSRAQLLSKGISLGVKNSPQPVSSYQNEILQLNRATEKLLAEIIERSIADIESRVSAGDLSFVPNLLVNFPPDNQFGWCYQFQSSSHNPEHVYFLNLQRYLGGINNMILDYIDMLITLSHAQSESEFDPKEARERSESRAKEVIARGSCWADGPRNTFSSEEADLILFSDRSRLAAEEYIATRSSDQLALVIETGIAPLLEWTENAQMAIMISALQVKTSYQDRIIPAARRSMGTAGNSQLISATTDLLDLNEQLRRDLQALEDIYDGYRGLPNAQRRLISGVRE